MDIELLIWVLNPTVSYGNEITPLDRTNNKIKDNNVRRKNFTNGSIQF